MAHTDQYVAKLSPHESFNTNNDNDLRRNEDDDQASGHVKAFAEDTSSGMGTTWPPRFYTCTFCRREFRSAQALGGHMNVHRRDRARLHQITNKTIMKNNNGCNPNPNPNPSPSTFNSTSSSTSRGSTLLIPTQDFLVNGGGLCLFYQLRSDNNNPDKNPSNTLIATFPNTAYQSSNTSTDHHHSLSYKYITSVSSNRYFLKSATISDEGGRSSQYNNTDEIDLELRLGHAWTDKIIN